MEGRELAVEAGTEEEMCHGDSDYTKEHVGHTFDGIYGICFI